jgi:hypothetical protein
MGQRLPEAMPEVSGCISALDELMISPGDEEGGVSR